MADRKGDWIQTFTGRQFWPLDPRPEDIVIEDIAHALAHQCRFAGHCRVHYSVADHSIRVSEQVPEADALWALLHDAAEAYLVDLPRPLKRLPGFEVYRTAEAAVMRALCYRFDLPLAEPEDVRRADQVLLATEARDLMGRPPTDWAPMPPPLGRRIYPRSMSDAERDFVWRFDTLQEARRG